MRSHIDIHLYIYRMHLVWRMPDCAISEFFLYCTFYYICIYIVLVQLAPNIQRFIQFDIILLFLAASFASFIFILHYHFSVFYCFKPSILCHSRAALARVISSISFFLFLFLSFFLSVHPLASQIYIWSCVILRFGSRHYSFFFLAPHLLSLSLSLSRSCWLVVPFFCKPQKWVDWKLVKRSNKFNDIRARLP